MVADFRYVKVIFLLLCLVAAACKDVEIAPFETAAENTNVEPVVPEERLFDLTIDILLQEAFPPNQAVQVGVEDLDLEVTTLTMDDGRIEVNFPGALRELQDSLILFVYSNPEEAPCCVSEEDGALFLEATFVDVFGDQLAVYTVNPDSGSFVLDILCVEIAPLCQQ